MTTGAKVANKGELMLMSLVKGCARASMQGVLNIFSLPQQMALSVLGLLSVFLLVVLLHFH